MLHAECRYLLAMGMLETALEEGPSAPAEQCFLMAERIALRPPYPEILWQVRLHLGRLLERSGRAREAGVRFREAFSGLEAVAREIPPAYRRWYLEVTGAAELARVAGEAGATVKGLP
jgi:hypothetical protein